MAKLATDIVDATVAALCDVATVGDVLVAVAKWMNPQSEWRRANLPPHAYGNVKLDEWMAIADDLTGFAAQINGK